MMFRCREIAIEFGSFFECTEFPAISSAHKDLSSKLAAYFELGTTMESAPVQIAQGYAVLSDKIGRLESIQTICQRMKRAIFWQVLCVEEHL